MSPGHALGRVSASPDASSPVPLVCTLISSVEVEGAHQGLPHGDVGGRQTFHLVEEELSDEDPVLDGEEALALDTLAVRPGDRGGVDLAGQQQVGRRRLVLDDPQNHLGREPGNLAGGAVGPPGVVVPGSIRVVVVGDGLLEHERAGAVGACGEDAAIGQACGADDEDCGAGVLEEERNGRVRWST